jgi:hypothetical protein
MADAVITSVASPKEFLQSGKKATGARVRTGFMSFMAGMQESLVV